VQRKNISQARQCRDFSSCLIPPDTDGAVVAVRAQAGHEREMVLRIFWDLLRGLWSFTRRIVADCG
jgi:hypothetical protein